MRARCLALLAALVAPGCFSFTWERDRSYVEPHSKAVTQIAIGRSSLRDCLALLGAPLLVEEYGDGMALYWGWTRRRNFGLSVDVPLSKSVNTSVSYSAADLARSGLLVVLDRDLVVELFQYGLLADLVGAVARRRPQLLQEGEAAGEEK